MLAVATSLCQIDFKFPPLLERYKNQFKRILIGIAADIQTNRGLLFYNEGAYNGHEKWKDLKGGLSKRSAGKGLMARRILQKTGALKNSISPKAEGDGSPGENGYVKFEGTKSVAIVKVGTTIAYAGIHDQGGTINHPGTSNGFGKGIKIPPHAINIPKRNFTDWNKADGDNMKIFLKNLYDVLNGR